MRRKVVDLAKIRTQIDLCDRYVSASELADMMRKMEEWISGQPGIITEEQLQTFIADQWEERWHRNHRLITARERP